MHQRANDASCVVTLGGGFGALGGVAVDANSNVYVADFNNSGVKEMMPRGVDFPSLPVGLNETQTLYFTFTLNAAASYSISASYSGDDDFLGGSSTANVLLTSSVQDFTVTPPSSGTGTLTNGSGTFSFTVTPNSATFPAPVSFTATGLPTGSTATFSPASFAAGSAGGPVQLTVVSSSASALFRNSRGLTLAVLFLPLLGLWRARRHLKAARLLALLILCLGLGVISGCGSSSGSHSYTLTVTATSNGVQHSFNLLLNTR